MAAHNFLMPLNFEKEYFEDRTEFFAIWPCRTITGWTMWTDCVKVWKFNPQVGWSIHFERLRSAR